jgi:hypothetical protein
MINVDYIVSIIWPRLDIDFQRSSRDTRLFLVLGCVADQLIDFLDGSLIMNFGDGWRVFMNSSICPDLWPDAQVPDRWILKPKTRRSVPSAARPFADRYQTLFIPGLSTS